MDKDSDEEEDIKKKIEEYNKKDALEEFLEDFPSNSGNESKDITKKDHNEESKSTTAGEEGKCSSKDEEEAQKDVRGSDVLQSYGYLIPYGFACLTSYLIGYIGWSILWIFFALLALTFYIRNKRAKKEKTLFARDICVRGEQKALECRFSELPSWVQFSDVDRAEWLNVILSIVWPHISYFMDHFLRATVEPLAREALEGYKLWDFKFLQINFGKIPPRICGIKVRGEPGSSEIVIDVDFEYNGDVDVSISVLKITSSVSDVQMEGKMRIVLKPIIEDIPFIGGIQIYLLKAPGIDFDLGGAASILDLPGLNNLIKELIVENIEHFAVLPNKINIMLSDKVSPLELKMPQPLGLIIVEVIEAKSLPSSMDFLSPIDPYVIIRYGSFELKTSVKSGSNPVWNEILHFPIEDLQFQDLSLTIFDRDVGSADDFAGSIKIDVQSIVKEGKIDEWIVLENVSSGLIHLRLSWSQVRSESFEGSDNGSILLCVFLDSVSVGPRYAQRPNLKTIIKAGEYSRETQNIYHGEKNPNFHEGFVLYVKNFDSESRIKFTIFDTRGDLIVSSGEFRIEHVAFTSRKNMSISTFKLNDNESTVSFAAQLHYLDKNINHKFAESVQSLLSSGSRRLVKGLGSSATGAARDVTGYAKNVKSATGTAIKNLGNVASNKRKIISSTLRKREDSESVPIVDKDNTQSPANVRDSEPPRSIKDQMKTLLRLG